MANNNTIEETKAYGNPEKKQILESVREKTIKAIEKWTPERKQEASAALENTETYRDMPVISEDDYIRFYNTDAAAMQNVLEGSTTTFNFQGYVRVKENGNLYYRDAMATNGLLKTDKHEGIHVGTDGVIGYDIMFDNRHMKGPEDVGEYDIYIKIPAEIQREKNVVCHSDSCETVGSYKEKHGPDVDDEIHSNQSGQHYIVIRTGLDPEKDPYARQKIYVIHQGIISHIKEGGRLEEIEDLVREMEKKFEELPNEKLALAS
jgi:hypothetical protein